MKKGTFAKFIGQSFHRTLYRTVCILVALTALTVWAVSGVYAKYVDSASVDGSPGVAGMGVTKFRLVEHQVEDISDNLSEALKEDRLYKLTDDYLPTGKGYTYKKVIPGTDIPKDPLIELVLENNEVSYELYLIVTESDNFPEMITYELMDEWEETETEGVYRYNAVFFAGTPLDTSIFILKDNKIKVSERFNSEENVSFSLTFTAYLQQYISGQEENSGTENGD